MFCVPCYKGVGFVICSCILFSSFVPFAPRTQIVSLCNHSLGYSTAIKVLVHYCKRCGSTGHLLSAYNALFSSFKAFTANYKHFPTWQFFLVDESRRVCREWRALKNVFHLRLGPDIPLNHLSMNDAKIPKLPGLCTVTSRTVTTIDNSSCNQYYQSRFRDITHISP